MIPSCNAFGSQPRQHPVSAKTRDQITGIFQRGGYYTMAERVKTNFSGELPMFLGKSENPIRATDGHSTLQPLPIQDRNDASAK
jgi:hypothetical protein